MCLWHFFLLSTLQMTVTITLRLYLVSSTVKRVKTFKLHPEYNINAKVKDGVKEFYDYDVALIQLEKDVEISSVAR